MAGDASPNVKISEPPMMSARSIQSVQNLAPDRKMMHLRSRVDPDKRNNPM
tara:strand:- start:753 stop:905 length:153 start_codon:yes stop_codon:yes gene_type:complete